MKNSKYNYLSQVIKPYLYIYILIAVFTFIDGFLSSFNIVAIYPILNFLFSNTAADMQPVLFKIQQMVGYLPFKDPVAASSVFLLTVTALSLLSSLFLAYLIGKGSSCIGYRLKEGLFKKYSSMNYQFFSEHKHGELFYYLFGAPQSVITLFTVMPQFFGEMVNILFLMLLLFAINIKITALLLVLTLVFIAIINGIARYISYNIGKARREFGIEQQVIANEFINGIKQITLYLAKPRWAFKFDRSNANYSKTFLRESVWLAAPKNILESLAYVSLIIIVLSTRHRAVPLSYFSSAAIYTAACIRLLPHISSVGRLRMTIMRLLPDTESLCKLASYQENKAADGAENFSSLKHSIAFDNVYFSYNQRPPLLKGINFSIDANKTTAIVGASGQGKTTIINLLLKLLEPDKGSILIDGKDLKDYSAQSWLKYTALVSQDPFIFHSTIKDNITFGDPAYSTEEITEAARISYADEFIKNFPQGYETIVGEKGMKLSTGQQQRIAIARAIIRNPSVLIFDEATNALDNISESMIQDAINNISKTKTVIIIAHRLSSIKHADKIIVIKDGTNVEEGTHDILMNAKQHYWNMYYA